LDKPTEVKNLDGKITLINQVGFGGARFGRLDFVFHPNNYKDMVYLDPLEVTNRLVPKLKNELKCDLIICLSHMGYSYQDDTISDLKLAANSRDIDLIIGGHTHTFLDKPTEVKNLDGKITLINQVGFGGARFGRLDFVFHPKTKAKRVIAYNNYTISDRMEQMIG